MALLPCRECGAQVSDGAPTCPSCGVASPGGQAQLVIQREKRLQGAIVPLGVWVDSSHLGSLRSGQSISMSVSPGVHRIEGQLEQAHSKGSAQEFDIPGGRSLVITVTLSRWNGKPTFTPSWA